MKTAGKQNAALVAGETDTLWKDSQLNDSTDAVAGMTVTTGTWAFADGTEGGIIFIRVSSVGAPAGMITQVDVQALANGLAKTIYSFSGLAINATGLYAFEIQPSSTPANWDGQIQAAMPNQGQLVLSLANKDDQINASVSLQSSW